ncbi:GNAT family N-acetyltransferase [Paenisporosarcina sp. TG20]|uniref:GNAT family N-acetyltransferase n=1 Tax=Paenisporosarcina sp. TG20 TaxID=1211706 RepID=UPI0002FCE04A|nr:GNAT family N-acetyltransferase [Paenisporosarcina sp. TG20]
MTLNYNDEISVIQYEMKYQSEWDDFVDKSKNGTFLHKINYFHYHKERFNDCSLIIKRNDQIVALMPGNIENEIFYTHSGLTFGGLITLNDTKVEDVLIYFNIINEYLINIKIKKVIYKAIPHIYPSIPAQEDEYALFRLGATLVSSRISSVINRDDRLNFSSLRRRNIRKAKKYNLEIKTDSSYEDFWFILTENLLKSHKVIPVHSLSEMMKLKVNFADNIKLYCVYLKEECLAGVVIYISVNVAHVQYISSNENGKKLAALDFLFDHLINNVYKDIKYFDLGTSVEDQGLYLNQGLIFQKQGFGGRGVLYQQFEYDVKNIIFNKKEN